jgi:hypothetical protein
MGMHTSGKFANGAITGAFVHLFNAEGYKTYSKRLIKVTLSGWKSDSNGRYKTWVADGVDTQKRAYGTYEYYDGKSPVDRFVNGVGKLGVNAVHFVGEHGDGIGLALSVGAMATPGGWGYAMGAAAIGIDIGQADPCGVSIGVGAMFIKSPIAGVVDIGYGISQLF